MIGGRVYRVDDRAAAPSEIYAIGGEAVTGIAFNRRGQFFYTNWNADRGYIHRLDLDSGDRVTDR